MQKELLEKVKKEKPTSKTDSQDVNISIPTYNWK